MAACRYESAPEAHEPSAQNYEPFDSLACSLAQGDLTPINQRKGKRNTFFSITFYFSILGVLCGSIFCADPS